MTWFGLVLSNPFLICKKFVFLDRRQWSIDWQLFKPYIPILNQLVEHVLTMYLEVDIIIFFHLNLIGQLPEPSFTKKT